MLLRELPATARVLVSPKYDLVQLIPYGASKAAALRWLLERWGVGMDEVISFGDDVNDVEMVCRGGVGGGDGERGAGGEGGGGPGDGQ